MAANRNNDGITLHHAALIAGFGMLLMAATAPFAEFFVFPKLIVHGDVEQTIRNILANRALYLAGVFACLINFVCDIVIAWALYILLGRRVGVAHGGPSAALGLAIGAAVIAPIGLAQAGAAMFSPGILPVALGVALLSSALPYSLEMFALTRLPARTFGVLMSLDPAFGALSGLVFLGERLGPIQWAAIACIMLASGGSAATSRTAPP